MKTTNTTTRVGSFGEDNVAKNENFDFEMEISSEPIKLKKDLVEVALVGGGICELTKTSNGWRRDSIDTTKKKQVEKLLCHIRDNFDNFAEIECGEDHQEYNYMKYQLRLLVTEEQREQISKESFLTTERKKKEHLSQTKGTIFGVFLTKERESGNSTRQVDAAIQMLFNGYKVLAIDHDNPHNNNVLISRIHRRLQNEHPDAKPIIDLRECSIVLEK